MVALLANQGVLAFRDAHGIRPLVFGVRESEAGKEYMVASESVALDVMGFKLIRDVAPGEAIISNDGELFTQQCADNAQLAPCIFEHVYFARPDSVLRRPRIARLRQGEKILAQRPEHDIDVVIPIPDSSRVAGQALAQKLGVKFREGLVKNRYIGRTFIMPGKSCARNRCAKSSTPSI